MNILDKIIAQKRLEVEEARSRTPARVLESEDFFLRIPVSMAASIRAQGATGIIAEFKRKSPSKGILNAAASVGRVTAGYVAAGASALSVLTDGQFFGGSNYDLITARKSNRCPILRKDFTIDEYQVVEAKAIGADAILLIAAALSPEEARALAKFAHSLKLEVLLEVHDEAELTSMLDVEADLIGVNNRNLKTFVVSIDTSRRLVNQIPAHVVKVSESGISEPAVIHDLRQHGYQGFLMGETFMKQQHPELAAGAFIESLKKYGKAEA